MAEEAESTIPVAPEEKPSLRSSSGTSRLTAPLIAPTSTITATAARTTRSWRAARSVSRSGWWRYGVSGSPPRRRATVTTAAAAASTRKGARTPNHPASRPANAGPLMIPKPATVTGMPSAAGPRELASALQARPAVQIVPSATPNAARVTSSDQKSPARPCPSAEEADRQRDQQRRGPRRREHGARLDLRQRQLLRVDRRHGHDRHPDHLGQKDQRVEGERGSAQPREPTSARPSDLRRWPPRRSACRRAALACTEPGARPAPSGPVRARRSGHGS